MIVKYIWTYKAYAYSPLIAFPLYNRAEDFGSTTVGANDDNYGDAAPLSAAGRRSGGLDRDKWNLEC